jgi:cardiolipin synthase C
MGVEGAKWRGPSPEWLWSTVGADATVGPMLRMAGAGIVLFLAAGCASVSPGPPAPFSSSVAASHDTSLGRRLQPLAERHPGESGFRLVNEGREAFALRAALADAAERSIDAQYFLWDVDAVGTILLHRVVRAAERGVRVRLLVDDLYITGRDAGIAALDAHPNVHVRLYNPFGARNRLAFGRRMDFLFEFGRLNHRMHNKLFVVDNEVAVVGGRNIADAYFGVDPALNFRDLDVVAAGPVVATLSAGFDTYWNSGWAVPIATLRGPPSSPQLNRVYERLETQAARFLASFPYASRIDAQRILDSLTAAGDGLIWARSEVAWADPEPGAAGRNGGGQSAVAEKLASIVDTTRFELVTESPYVVPAAEMPAVRQLRGRGVSVRVLTNSLASTDEPPAYAIYAKDRRRMLEQGVDLYEIRPDAASRRIYTAHPGGRHRLALHAKLAVFDREVLYVGSFNLDPRSRFLNTEVALVVYSPALAAQLLGLLERDFEPANSWRVVLEPRAAARENQRVSWVGEESAAPRHRAPGAGFWRRVAARVLAALPIRDQL